MKGKGKIEIGQDADLALVDMNSRMKVDDSRSWSKVGWNPFHGHELVGWTIATFVGGVQVFERDFNENMKGKIIVSAGQTGNPLEMA
jgi:dihydroorotase-like cyclic amidohydrolase